MVKSLPGVAAAAALLAGCGGGETAFAPPCPDVVIVQELAEVTKFRPGEGRDLTDVVLEGRVATFRGFCETDIDDGKPVEVTVELQLVFDVSRGPANTDRKGSFRYFVALNDSADKPVQKHIFDAEVEFAGNRNRIAPFEELTLTVPLREGENGADYTVYVGFQLTSDELVYNRNLRPR
jgi:hypothetical protein